MTKVLVFVEDPGAANFVADLPRALAASQVEAKLVAAGAARGYLADRGVRSLDAPSSVERILDEHSPDLIVVGTSENPDSLGLALVPAARARGVTTVGVVDAYANAEHRFRGRTESPLSFCPDRLLVPDRWTREAFIGLGVDPTRVLACGHPHYDRVLDTRAALDASDRDATRRRLFGEHAEAPVVLFVSEISTGLDPSQFRRSASYSLAGRGARDGRTEIVLEELLDGIAEVSPSTRVALRLHPKNTREELGALIDEVAVVSSGGSPLEAVHAADLVVGMTSMLLMEAALLGRRTLAIVPREIEREWLPTLRTGVTPVVSTRESLREHLQSWSRGGAGGTPELPVERGSLDRVCRSILEVLSVESP